VCANAPTPFKLADILGTYPLCVVTFRVRSNFEGCGSFHPSSASFSAPSDFSLN
jgi:hypothetical protein